MYRDIFGKNLRMEDVLFINFEQSVSFFPLKYKLTTVVLWKAFTFPAGIVELKIINLVDITWKVLYV